MNLLNLNIEDKSVRDKTQTQKSLKPWLGGKIPKKNQKLEKIGRISSAHQQKILGILGVKSMSHILKLAKWAGESYWDHFDFGGKEYF